MSDNIRQLARSAVQARRENRLAEAKRDLVEAVGMCREQSLSLELALVLRELGEVERGLRNLDGARDCYEEAVVLLRNNRGEPLRLAHTIRHLGDVYYDAGHAELAEPCYEESLHLYGEQREAPPLDVANAIRSLAVLKYDAGDKERATLLWQEAHDLYATLGIEEGVNESSRRLAHLRTLPQP